MRAVGSVRWSQQKLRAGGRCLLLPFKPFLYLYSWAFEQHRLSHSRLWKREDWRKYHSEWRWANGLFGYLGPPSFMLYNIRVPLLAQLIITVAVAVWSHSDLPKINKADMPNLWGLGSFALSLLLAFRIRTAYERWWFARTSFEIVTSQVAVLVGQFAKYARDRRLVDNCVRWCIVWQFAVYQNCTGAKELHPTAEAQLNENESGMMRASTKTRVTAANQVRRLIVQANMTEGEKQNIEQAWRAVWENAAMCARIALTGFPYSVSLLTTGFVVIWTLLLPVSYLGHMEWIAIIPLTAMALLLLGIDEVSTQLEDPWPLLPLQDLLNGGVTDIRSAVREDEQWAALEAGGSLDGVLPQDACPPTCLGGGSSRGPSKDGELAIAIGDGGSEPPK